MMAFVSALRRPGKIGLRGGEMSKSKLSFYICFALVSTTFSVAQAQIGVVGVLNQANLRSDYHRPRGYDYRSNTGFGIGAVLDLKIYKDISLRLEPMYLQKGTAFRSILRYADARPRMADRVTVSSFYLEIPAQLRLDLRTGILRPYLLVGPSIGFLLSSKRKDGFLSPVPINDYGSTDLSFSLGGGLSFPLGRDRCFLEATYNQGLVDIANNEGKLNPIEIRTMGVQIRTGIVYIFRK